MKNHVTWVWMVLVLFTMVAYMVGVLELVSAWVVGVLLITSGIKGHLIINDFMGLRSVVLFYRMIPILWLSVVLILIGLAFYWPAS